MKSPIPRRLRASPFFPELPALCLSLALASTAVPAVAGELVARTLPGGDYATARQALVEAIESEGLVPGPVSAFADMLRRTDASLGHGGDLYAEAEVFSFCSIAIAAQLVRENPERIADCPLTIALYRRKGSDELRLTYRGRDGDTPGSRAANRLLQRIAERAAALLPAAGRR